MASRTSATSDRSRAPLAGKRCLVLEDEFLIALDYERILQSAGAEAVISAGCLKDAEDLLQQHGAVDFVLLDVDLNGQSSIPLAKQLVTNGIPLVIVTGLTGRPAWTSGLRAMQTEGVQTIGKPFEERALLTAIAGALSGPVRA